MVGTCEAALSTGFTKVSSAAGGAVGTGAFDCTFLIFSGDGGMDASELSFRLAFGGIRPAGMLKDGSFFKVFCGTSFFEMVAEFGRPLAILRLASKRFVAL